MRARSGRRGAGPALGGAAVLALLIGGGACDEPCCTIDGQPITLIRGPAGELLVGVRTGTTTSGLALFDTGAAMSLWHTARPATPPTLVARTITLVGPAPEGAVTPARAVFRGLITAETTVGAVGTAADNLRLAAVLGGDLMRGFAVEIRFAIPEATFWPREPATDNFLASSNYAVLHLPRRGGGELESQDPGNFLGEHAPHQVPPSRLLLRACAAPDVFRREDPLPVRCCRGEEQSVSTGTDLSLLLSTGAGPTVLGRAAWERIRLRLDPAPPPGERRPVLLAQSATPIDAEWVKLPRLALVNRQAELSLDPGPCAELARSRRLEQVELLQVQNSSLAACALPCDRDPQASERAQNSAAYLELGEALDVAVIADVEPLLQAVRMEVRPLGPEVDGFLGAAALARTRLELDYVSKDTRAIFSCTPEAAQELCRSVASCPRLPAPGQIRACFGLPAHGLPQMCETPKVTCGS
jgi:hypothetical protein